MSNIQRWSLLALAVVVLVVGYLALRPKDDDNGKTATAPATVTQVVTVDGSRTTTTERTQTVEKPAAPAIQTIRVKDGQPVGGVKELDFEKGDTIAFKVTATAPGGEVHFHGYDIAKEIPASGGTATYSVPATADGIFEVEMEATGVQIGKVVVQP